MLSYDATNTIVLELPDEPYLDGYTAGFKQAGGIALRSLSDHTALARENALLYQRLAEANRCRDVAEEALRSTLANLAQVARLTTMGELVASIIHEVTQPLTAIGTLAAAATRLLSAETETPNVTEAKDMMRLLLDDSARAGQIIRCVRAMARKSEPCFEDFDLHLAIAEVLALLRGQMNDFHIDLDNRLSGAIFVRGDRVQVQQVALNLIVNAVEAMCTNRTHSRTLTISSEATHQGLLCIQVTDTGPGIAPSVAEHLFEPFVTTKQCGVGMGLSISRTIIEAHGGTLSVHAGAVRGTTFSFTLRAADEPA